MRAALLSLLVLALAALAQAEPVTVTAPPDRFVAPGEFVTLVFRLEADEAAEVRVEASVSAGWTVVRQPGEMTLEAGRSTPVAVTVEVPSDAEAFAVERVSLNVEVGRAAFDRVVHLTVTERAALSLQAPRALTLTPEGLEVTVANDGNAAERATLELRRGATVLARRELELAAGERVTLRFELRQDGIHTLVLTGERTGEARRSVSVVRFGVPAPEPFALAGEVIGSIGSTGAWRGTLTLRGPLSDRATVDARLEAAALRRSFAQVTFEHASVHVGGGWRDPLRLGVPSGLGVAGSYRMGSVALVAAVGEVDDGLATGVAAEWTGADVRVAAGVGSGEDAPWLAARVASVTDVAGPARWSVAAAYRESALTFTAGGEFRADDVTANLELEARKVLDDDAVLAASFRVRDAVASLYADARLPLDPDASWSGRVGVTERVASPLPGEVRVAFQAGTNESFARVSHQATVGAGWRATTGFGVRGDATGVGLTLESAWSYVDVDAFGADARLVYYPDTATLGGRLAARYRLEREAFSVSLGGSWNLSEKSTGASTAVGWRDGPWRIEVSGAVAYAYDQPTTPWSGSLALTTRYEFELQVPDAVVEWAGGRNLGTIHGRVLADDASIEGVEVNVGRYRVRSDEDGVFELDLPPGSYQVSVDVATLPLAYQLVGEPRRTVEVRRRATAEVRIDVVQTAVLRGRVLEDRAGDGRGDEPAVGVLARLLVTDAEGMRRSVVSDDAGAFVVRGLLPGEVRVRLIDVPSGATIVGDDERGLVLAPGIPGEVEFLVRPAVVTVRSFTPQALRIRSVAPEVDRVPAGAAPLVRVEVQGEPEAVTLVTGAGAEVVLARDGDAWFGRVPVPLEQSAGVLDFTVTARTGEAEATRRGQVIVDASARAVQVVSDAPVRSGGVLTVSVSAYLEARGITLAQPFGDDVALAEGAPGRWSATVTVPAGTPDAVYELAIRVESVDGRSLVETLRFRVLAP